MPTLRHIALPLVLAVLALPLAACASSGDGPCERGFVTTLYLGRAFKDPATGKPGHVDDAALSAFLHEVVAARFPDGFTLLPATGWWRPSGTADTVKEDSIVLEVVHCETAAAEEGLRAVAAAYAERFHQEAILRTDTRARIWW